VYVFVPVESVTTIVDPGVGWKQIIRTMTMWPAVTDEPNVAEIEV
jgi:hypothetical protein